MRSLSLTPFARLSIMPLILVALVVLGLSGLGGCTAVNSFTQAPANIPVERIAVAAAVATVVGADQAKAAHVISIAKAVLAADTGAAVALSDVELLVNARVAALGLPPVDAALAAVLMAAVSQAIQNQINISTQGVVSPQTQLAIATVCKWVIADAGGTP